MRKWPISYLFIICCICLHTGSFANPATTSRTAATIKSAYTTISRVFTVENADLALTNHQAESNGDIFFQHRNLRVLYSVVSYFKAELNFFLTISRHVPGGAINKNEVESVVKDHLLHLYPSHYFW